MDVGELQGLCNWYVSHARNVVTQFKSLHTKLNHNATQQKKQPLREDLNSLLDDLRAMPMHLLSREQIAVMEREGILGQIGKEGARYIDRLVKSARFDPATAAKEIGEVYTSLDGFLRQCIELKQQLSNMSLIDEETSSFDQIAVRVHFRDGAGINDISQLKSWSQEWYDIMRGIALCVDEAPETVKVLGARQGSVIVVLGTTAAATALLLVISNHLTKIALNGLTLANAVADFKHKTKLNKTVLNGLEKAIEDQEKSGIKELLDAATASLAKPPNGEQVNALKKSVEKLHKFSKQGGEVDILPPPEPDDEDSETLSNTDLEDLRNIRSNHDELRNAREEMRLLSDQSEPDEDFADEDLEDEDE